MNDARISLFKGWPGTPAPTKPNDDVRGEIPARALKFCEPFLAANRAGWLLYPPIGFTLIWTGGEVLAQVDGIEETMLVERLFLPDFADHWKTVAPEHAVDVMPPFLEAFPERGVVQVWSGLFATTAPEVGLWVRGPVNRSASTAWSVVEGIVDTDWWMGPLFFVLQIEKTDFPVRFSPDVPFLQVVPVAKALLGRKESAPAFEDVSRMPAELWDAMASTALRRNSEPPGSYRREARKRERTGTVEG